MLTHNSRVLVRSGAWPALFARDAFPTTESEFYSAIERLTGSNQGDPPAIVSGGWGYFLKRRGPKGPRLFTHLFVGKPKGVDLGTREQGRIWRSGSTIASVQSDLASRNPPLTLSSCPSMQYIGLGSWVATACHGNEGDEALAASEIFAAVYMADMRDEAHQPPRRYTYAEARNIFDRQEDAKMYAIVYVVFSESAFVTNDDLQKSAIRIDAFATEREKGVSGMEKGGTLRIAPTVRDCTILAQAEKWLKPGAALNADEDAA